MGHRIPTSCWILRISSWHLAKEGASTALIQAVAAVYTLNACNLASRECLRLWPSSTSTAIVRHSVIEVIKVLATGGSRNLPIARQRGSKSIGVALGVEGAVRLASKEDGIGGGPAVSIRDAIAGQLGWCVSDAVGE